MPAAVESIDCARPGGVLDRARLAKAVELSLLRSGRRLDQRSLATTRLLIVSRVGRTHLTLHRLRLGVIATSERAVSPLGLCASRASECQCAWPVASPRSSGHCYTRRLACAGPSRRAWLKWLAQRLTSAAGALSPEGMIGALTASLAGFISAGEPGGQLDCSEGFNPVARAARAVIPCRLAEHASESEKGYPC